MPTILKRSFLFVNFFYLATAPIIDSSLFIHEDKIHLYITTNGFECHGSKQDDRQFNDNAVYQPD